MKNYLSKHIACSNGAYRKFSGNKNRWQFLSHDKILSTVFTKDYLPLFFHLVALRRLKRSNSIPQFLDSFLQLFGRSLVLTVFYGNCFLR